MRNHGEGTDGKDGTSFSTGAEKIPPGGGQGAWS